MSIRSTIEDHIRELAGIDGGTPIDTSCTLRMVGVDSLGVIELIMRIESELEREVPDEMFTEDAFRTIDSFIGCIEGLASSARSER